MFCVIYEFHVKEESTNEFLELWSAFTKVIYRVSGSLGSRLHKTKEPHIYVAYAQWPSEEIFNSASLDHFSESEKQMRDRMRATTHKVKVLHKLQVIDDLLK